MGFATFWTNITSPRVREITPPKNRYGVLDSRPATSSGVRTIRKTPSIDDESGRELNQVESLLTKNVIEPPPAAPTTEEKKSRRRSRGLSLSRSKTEDGLKRRKSLFGGKKDVAKEEAVPEVPTLPTMSAIYSRQAPQHLDIVERPGTAVSTNTVPSSPTSRLPAFTGGTRQQAPHHLDLVDRPSTAVSAITTSSSPSTARLPAFTGVARQQPKQQPPPIAASEVFELPAELPAPERPIIAELPAASEIEVKKARRRSLGEVLSGKRSRSMGNVGLSSKTATADAPATPALPVTESKPAAPKSTEEVWKTEQVQSRRNSNASVASKASRMSRKSRRKSWWQRGKGRDEEIALLPPMPAAFNAQTMPAAKDRKTASPENIDLSAFPAVPAKKQAKEDDDAASIRTTLSERATARSTKPQRIKSTKRPQSTASTTRRKRRSWWTSSNPDDAEDESNPLPPVPLLIRSARTTPDSSPTNSETGRSPSYTAVRGDNIKAPRPVSGISTKSRTYTPRSAAKSFLVSTTPVSDNIRKSVRHSLHACEDLDSGFENDRGTYCLSAEQQQEWEKLKHLMAVMDRRRDATRKTFGEESVADMFPATPKDRGGNEEREGVKFSNHDALAALDVGVAR